MTVGFLSLFGRLAGSFLVPAKTRTAGARRRGQGRPSGRRAKRACLDRDEHDRRLVITGTFTRLSRAGRAAMLLALPALALSTVLKEHALAAPVPQAHDELAAAVDEAAARFGLPAGWIWAVIATESRGDRRAISVKGAMGVMQLMPGTWAEVRQEVGLGVDPFDARDNVLAGTAYLRRLYDQFGVDGAFAAYNAGPARYAAHLADQRPLPLETQLYAAAIARRLGAVEPRPGGRRDARSDWRTAPLFAVPKGGPSSLPAEAGP